MRLFLQLEKIHCLTDGIFLIKMKKVDKRTLANELKLKLFLKNENSKLQSQKSDNVRGGSDTDKDK